MKGITPFIWFDKQAEEAVNFYVSVFPNSKILKTLHYGDTGPGAKGTVMTIEFELDGQLMTALNGGPEFKHSPAFSLVARCESQEEIDRIWTALSADPSAEQCGWLKDKYGLSWQIVPNELMKLIGDDDPERTNRVTEAIMKMKKIDIDELKRARDGETVRA